MVYVIQVFRQLASRIRIFHPGPACKAVCKPVWHIPLLCVQWKTPDDEQRNCPKHVEFHSKNKFEKLVHLFGFIITNSFAFLLLFFFETVVYLMVVQYADNCWQFRCFICLFCFVCNFMEHMWKYLLLFESFIIYGMLNYPRIRTDLCFWASRSKQFMKS